MARIKRPTTFKLGCFDWNIEYIDTSSDLHGDTDLDSKVIRVFTGAGRGSEQVIKDTLLHECLHACLEDIVESAVKSEYKTEDIEEQLVRLLTPRLHCLFSDNQKLKDYIFGKRVDKSAKK